MWYNSAMRNEDDDDPVARTLYPQGRSWENVTKEMREVRHGTKAYNDEVTQRLRTATCKEDVLEILDSIKEDLYNGNMELYNEHKYND